MKFLLIDSNHLACRMTFAHSELRTTTGIPTGVHYGFMSSLINLKQQYSDRQFLISWDGKSQRRVLESKAGVEKGLIKSGYKENRDKPEDMPQPLKDFHAQAPFLKRALEQTGIPQVRLPEFETDDIIFSYCNKLKKDNDIICVTGDSDYYQLLDNNVTIWNDGKKILITKDSFIKEYGITPSQFVDMCGFFGDNSDNIFGVTGVGEKTALEMIKNYGTKEKVLEALHKQLDPLRIQYPDLKPDSEDFKILATLETPSKKLKYPEINTNTPFTGVALALENKKIKKLAKTDLMTLMFEERVKLAHSLKKMDIIPNLPEIKQGEFNEDKLQEYLDYYEMHSLKSTINILKG